ncbi:MAG: hypothetical protein K2O63_04185 [Alistipes sp.]|nr:hypothetical protein [Alistipes sp.]
MKIKLFALAALSAFTLLTACDNGKEDVPVPPKVTKEFYVLATATTPYSATMRVTPTTDNAKETAWLMQVFSKEMVEEFGGGSVATEEDLNLSAESCALAMMEAIISQNSGFSYEQIYNALTDNGTMKGTKTVLLSEVGVTNPGETCYALTVGVDQNLGFTTNAQFDAFTMQSLPALVEEECGFQLEVVPSSNGLFAELRVQPEKGDVNWLSYMVSKTTYDQAGGAEAFKETILPLIVNNMAASLNTTVIDAIAQMVHKGKGTVEISGLTPESGYVAFVCAVDQYGRATSEVVLEEFETPAFVPSEARIDELTFKLYNGNEIDPVQYPELAQLQGLWFLRLTPTLAGTAAYWNCVFSLQDYSEEAQHTLIYFIVEQGVGQGSFFTDDFINIAAPSPMTGQTVYGYAVAIDEEGQPGNVVQASAVCSTDKASPITDITGSLSTSAVRFCSAVMQEEAPAYKMSFVAAE